MGYLAKVFYPKVLGIVVTASHNPMKDNGIKLLDIHGGYIRINLEATFNSFVNEEDLSKGFADFKASIQNFFDLKIRDWDKGRCLIGRDTRLTSPEISNLMVKAIQLLNSDILDFGEQTTPQIQWYISKFNTEHSLQKWWSC